MLYTRVGAFKQHAGKKTHQTFVTTEVKSGAVLEIFL